MSRGLQNSQSGVPSGSPEQTQKYLHSFHSNRQRVTSFVGIFLFSAVALGGIFIWSGLGPEFSTFFAVVLASLLTCYSFWREQSKKQLIDELKSRERMANSEREFEKKLEEAKRSGQLDRFGDSNA